MRAVGFDFDGVLVASREEAWRAAERVVAAFGITVDIRSPEDMDAAFGHAAQAALVGREHADALRMMHRLLMRHTARDLAVMNDVLAIAAKIDAPRILITAALADGVEACLGPASSMFDEIVGFETGRKPELLASRAAELGVYVTDTASDVEICRALGIPVVACTWASYDQRTTLASAMPDAIADSPAELFSLIGIHNQTGEPL